MKSGQLLEVPEMPPFGLPENASLTIRFGSHVSALDLGTSDEFALQLKGADLFAPETPGWDSSSLTAYNKVASGDLKMLRRVEDEADNARPEHVGYGRALMEGLFWHGNKLKVIFLDIPESPLFHSIERNLARQGLLQSKWLPFVQAVEGLHALLVEQAVLNIKREHVILTKLKPTIEDTIARTPRLRGKNPVRVLAYMGSFHLEMGNAIVRRQAQLGVSGFNYTQHAQPGSEHTSGREFMDQCRLGVVPTFELAARAYAMNLAAGRVPFSATENNGVRIARIQTMVDEMSLDDIEKMYNEYR
jgi:hypothetical protein